MKQVILVVALLITLTIIGLVVHNDLSHKTQTSANIPSPAIIARPPSQHPEIPISLYNTQQCNCQQISNITVDAANGLSFGVVPVQYQNTDIIIRVTTVFPEYNAFLGAFVISNFTTIVNCAPYTYLNYSYAGVSYTGCFVPSVTTPIILGIYVSSCVPSLPLAYNFNTFSAVGNVSCAAISPTPAPTPSPPPPSPTPSPPTPPPAPSPTPSCHCSKLYNCSTMFSLGMVNMSSLFTIYLNSAGFVPGVSSLCCSVYYTDSTGQPITLYNIVGTGRLDPKTVQCYQGGIPVNNGGCSLYSLNSTMSVGLELGCCVACKSPQTIQETTVGGYIGFVDKPSYVIPQLKIMCPVNQK